MGHGICVEKGCKKYAVIDYNGCEHWVCKTHFDSLTNYFESEYN